MRRLLFALLIVNGVLLPVGCVPALFLMNTVNPMTMTFVTDIHVTNGSGVPIIVTPVGTIGPDGRRTALPIYSSRLPAIPASRSGGFAVSPGQTLDLLYDWDDVNFSEIVVVLGDGSARQLVVDPRPTVGQYRPPTTNRFTIGDPSRLPPVPPDVAAAAARAQRPQWHWFAILPLFLPWLTFYLLLRGYRRRQTAGGPVVTRPTAAQSR